MIIKSIELVNFRQYKGSVQIDFSTDPERNVTVIIGQNTGGKTTLVRSFIWCLYGDVGFKDKRLLNAEIAHKLEQGGIGGFANVEVKINLIHNETGYIICRKEKYVSQGNGKFKTTNTFEIYQQGSFGSLRKIDEKDHVKTINDILPKELSDYFFFWGERIETLSDKSNVDKAVKNFLGLNTIDNTRRHLNLALQEFNQVVVNNSYDDEIRTAQQKIDRYTAAIEKSEKLIQEYEASKTYYDDQFQKAQTELYSLKGKEELQNTLTKLSIIKNTKDNELVKEKENLVKIFNNNSIAYFSQPVAEAAVNILKNNPEESVGWAHINVKGIDEIIRKGKCICGATISSGSEAYLHLVEQKKIVAPNVIGAMSQAFITKARTQKRYFDNYKDNVHSSYSKIDEIEVELTNIDSEISAIQISANDATELENKKKKVQSCKQKYEEALQKLTTEKDTLERNKKFRDKYTKDKDKLLHKKQIDNKNYLYYLYARAVLADIDMDYKGKEEEIKEKLQKYSQDYFDQMYTGSRIVKITDKYNIETYNNVGGRLIKSETSPGLETVKNFAFIAALVQIAKEKISLSDLADDKENIISSEPYPLVLDAPFSQADENHVPAISKLISSIAEQIILVVMEKDWNFAKDDLAEKVGKAYHLEKLSETTTEVKLGGIGR